SDRLTNRKGESASKRSELRETPIAKQTAGLGSPECRRQIPNRKEDQVVALIEIGVAPVPARIELARERSVLAARGVRADAREQQIEKITRQRLALLVNRVAPGISELKLLAPGAIAGHRRQRVVIGKPLPGAIVDNPEIVVEAAESHAVSPVHDIGDDQLAPQRSQRIDLDRPVVAHLPLDPEKIAVHVSVAQVLIEERQVRETSIEKAPVQRLERLRDRLQVIRGTTRRQVESRQREVVCAQILPQVVVRPVVEQSVSAANQSARVPQQIVRETESRRPIVLVRLIELLVARAGINQLRARKPLSEIGAIAKLDDCVLYRPGVAGGAVLLVTDAVIQRQPRRRLERVLREKEVLVIAILAIEIGRRQPRQRLPQHRRA